MPNNKPPVRVTRTKPARRQLEIHGDEVKITVTPEEIEEVAVADAASGPPTVPFDTPDGKAVYVHAGDCYDCKADGVDTPVFSCTSHPIRADEQLGNQLAGFWRSGRAALPLCQDHFRARTGRLPEGRVIYKKVG